MNTSRDNEDDILDSFAAGADGYITKVQLLSKQFLQSRLLVRVLAG